MLGVDEVAKRYEHIMRISLNNTVIRLVYDKEKQRILLLAPVELKYSGDIQWIETPPEMGFGSLAQR